MSTWTCIRCGPIELDQINNLTWDSPHNEETHVGCGGVCEPTDRDEPTPPVQP